MVHGLGDGLRYRRRDLQAAFRPVERDQEVEGLEDPALDLRRCLSKLFGEVWELLKAFQQLHFLFFLPRITDLGERGLQGFLLGPELSDAVRDQLHLHAFLECHHLRLDLPVRATDIVGSTDPTPASRSFTADTAPPKTTVTKKPKSKIKKEAKTAKVKVSFKSDAGVSFQCKLDSAGYKPCISPYSVKAKSKSGKGKKRTISIRATDKAGSVGPAATVKFTVIRKG